jgi:signal transduction histidine kinase
MSVRNRSRLAVAWLQVLLVVVLACVVLILAEASRAARSSQVMSERALRDYADFAAWSFREHLRADIRAAVDELLGPVNHGEGMHEAAGIPEARELGHYLRWDGSCLCHRPRKGPMPDRFIGFTLGSDTLGVGVNLAPSGTEGWLVDPPMGRHYMVPAMVYTPDEVQWINGMLTRVARRWPKSEWGYDVIVTHRGPQHRFFASRSMPTVWGDTVVYAFEYRPTAVDSLLAAVLTSSDLLPASLVGTRDVRDLLDVQVDDGNGRPLFMTGKESQRWELDATTVMPESFGGLRVRSQLRPELASALLIGGTPRSRVPLLLVILALTIALSILAALQLRREVRFASERSTFVANVSHELRTPLAQVRLVLDTLRLGRGGDAEARAKALGVADREVLRLQHLVEGVLRFTRGPKHDDAPRVPVDVAREARTVASEFQPLATPREVHVEVEGDAPVTATLQNGALRQILLNLFDNAVKYGRDGSTVTCEVRTLPGGGARVSVTDRGQGVPVSDRERIWRPFERGGAAKHRVSGGSGIGLTIVREIAEDHGGRAWVEDAPGGGARFVVDLPDEKR